MEREVDRSSRFAALYHRNLVEQNHAMGVSRLPLLPMGLENADTDTSNCLFVERLYMSSRYFFPGFGMHSIFPHL